MSLKNCTSVAFLLIIAVDFSFKFDAEATKKGNNLSYEKVEKDDLALWPTCQALLHSQHFIMS